MMHHRLSEWAPLLAVASTGVSFVEGVNVVLSTAVLAVTLGYMIHKWVRLIRGTYNEDEGDIMKLNWQAWLYGLFATIIGGIGNGVVLVVAAPESFNLSTGFGKLWQTALVLGLLNAGAYLKRSPLPAVADDDRKQLRLPIALMVAAFFGPMFFVALLILALTGSGCATTSSTPSQAQKTAIIVEASAQLGTFYALRENPDLRSYFTGAVIAIDVALQQGVILDPAALATGLAKIEVQELQRPEIQTAIGASLRLYEAYWSEQVAKKIDSNVFARPLLTALRDGISKALAARVSNQAFELRGVAGAPTRSRGPPAR